MILKKHCFQNLSFYNNSCKTHVRAGNNVIFTKHFQFWQKKFTNPGEESEQRRLKANIKVRSSFEIKTHLAPIKLFSLSFSSFFSYLLLSLCFFFLSFSVPLSVPPSSSPLSSSPISHSLSHVSNPNIRLTNSVSYQWKSQVFETYIASNSKSKHKKIFELEIGIITSVQNLIQLLSFKIYSPGPIQ